MKLFAYSLLAAFVAATAVPATKGDSALSHIPGVSCLLSDEAFAKLYYLLTYNGVCPNITLINNILENPIQALTLATILRVEQNILDCAQLLYSSGLLEGKFITATLDFTNAVVDSCPFLEAALLPFILQLLSIELPTN